MSSSSDLEKLKKALEDIASLPEDSTSSIAMRGIAIGTLKEYARNHPAE